MSINSTQWGFFTKLLYKFFRPELERIVKDTNNTVDDTVLKVADSIVGK